MMFVSPNLPKLSFARSLYYTVCMWPHLLFHRPTATFLYFKVQKSLTIYVLLITIGHTLYVIATVAKYSAMSMDTSIEYYIHYVYTHELQLGVWAVLSNWLKKSS